MITVSKEQMNTFYMADKEIFINEMLEEIKKDIPSVNKYFHPKMLYDAVAYSLDRAIANGFTDDLDIRTFVGLMFIIGPDFDQHPEVHKLLADSSLSTEERWDVLTEASEFSDILEELSTPSHQNTWFPEAHGSIEKAYPTTYILPRFRALYDKVRAEKYSFLAPGESLSDA